MVIVGARVLQPRATPKAARSLAWGRGPGRAVSASSQRRKTRLLASTLPGVACDDLAGDAGSGFLKADIAAGPLLVRGGQRLISGAVAHQVRSVRATAILVLFALLVDTHRGGK